MRTDHLTGAKLPTQSCLLLYDGECRLCVFTKSKIEQLTAGQTSIRYLAYQTEEARGALDHNHHRGPPDAAILIQPSGKVFHGLDAFLPLLPHLPGGKLVYWVLRVSMVRRLGEWGYRMVARYRYQLFGAIRLPG